MENTVEVTLYSIIGFLYLILTNVEFPTKIDNYLRKRHNIAYSLLGTCYILITLKYVNKKKKSRNKENNINKNILNLFFVSLLSYVWYKLLKK